MTSSSNVWVQCVCATDMWARSTVDVDWSTVNMGRVSYGLWWAWVGPGFGPPRGILCRCHVTAFGLHWAVVFDCGRERGSRWTKRRWSMDRRQVYSGPSPPFISQAWSMCTVFTHVWPARGVSPVFPMAELLPAASSLGEPPRWCWCPIEEGKSSLTLWRVRRWGSADG